MSNIYLVGFMGTGKTQAGRLLAQRLNRPFVDMDELIVDRQKMPIAEIFRLKGEPYFRKLEKGVVNELCRKDGIVVACGGGAFVDQENIRCLKDSGTVICLTSTPEVILKRTKAYKVRPLLNVADPKAQIQALLRRRMPYYAQAHYTIDADKLSVEETVVEILNQLKLK